MPVNSVSLNQINTGILYIMSIPPNPVVLGGFGADTALAYIDARKHLEKGSSTKPVPYFEFKVAPSDSIPNGKPSDGYFKNLLAFAGELVKHFSSAKNKKTLGFKDFYKLAVFMPRVKEQDEKKNHSIFKANINTDNKRIVAFLKQQFLLLSSEKKEITIEDLAAFYLLIDSFGKHDGFLSRNEQQAIKKMRAENPPLFTKLLNVQQKQITNYLN